MSIREDLKAYLDGELSEQRAAEVRSALEADPELRKEAEALKAISDTFRLVAPAPAPVGMDKTLEAVERAKGLKRPAGRQLWGWALAAAVTVVIAFALLPILFGPQASSGEVAFNQHATSGAVAGSVERPDLEVVAPSAAAPAAQVKAGDEVLMPQHSIKNIKPATRKSGEAEIDKLGVRDDGSAPGQGYIEQGTVEIGRKGAGEAPAKTSDQEQAPAIMNPSPAGAAAATPAKPTVLAQAPVKSGLMRSAKATTADAATPQRFIIYNGNLGIYVKSVKDAKNAAERATRSVGGYVESSDLTGEKPEDQRANLTLRVPVERYASVLEQIKALGEVNHDSSSGNDVTTQVVDTDAHLKNMRAEEQQYQDILKHTKRISDVLDVRERLGDIRGQIEGLEATDKQLRSSSALSTIVVEFSVKPKPAPQPVKPVAGLTDAWPLSEILSAGGALMEVAKLLATMVIYLLVFSPLWAPAALLTWWGVKVSRPEYRY